MQSRQLGKSVWAALQMAAFGASAAKAARTISEIWAPLIRAPRVRMQSVETGLHAPHRVRRTVASERRAAAKRLAVRRERARRKARARR